MGRTERKSGSIGNSVARGVGTERWKSEREGRRCMEVLRSTEQEIGKLYVDQRPEMQQLEVEQLSDKL